MADSERRGWRRQWSVVKFDSFDPRFKYALKRGVDRPLSPRGRFLWRVFLVVVLTVGVLFVAISR